MAQNVRKNLVATIITSATAVPLDLNLLIQPLYANVLPTQAPRFAGTGGAGGYIYSVLAGGAPTGMTFNANGTVTGTPTTQGSYPITVQVQDSLGQQFARTFVIVVTAPLFTLQGGRDPTPASRTRPYSFQFRAADAFGSTAGITYTIVSGALPTGITLTGATGVISGTPTVLGISYFRVRATKAGVGFIEWSTQLNVRQNISAIGTVLNTPQELRHAVVGVPVNAQFTFTNLFGVAPYTLVLSSGALPAGLVMDTQGNVTGTPTAPTPAAYTQPQITVFDMTGNSFTDNANINVGSQLRSSATQGQFYTTDSAGNPQPVDYLSAYFGSQADGAVTINGTNNYAGFAALTLGINNMQRPIFASTLTITGSGKLNNRGHDIYCDTLDISAAGLNGIFCSSAGSILPGTVSRAAGPWGAEGGVAVAGGINAGTTGNAGFNLVVGVTGGAQGGTGGPGNPGGLGPVAASVSCDVTTVPRTLLENCIAQIYNGIAAGITANACIPIGGGCGGGSGGGGGGNGVAAGGFSGNGGGGNGRIRIFARNIIRSASTAAGAINVSGFKGAAGSNGPAANRGAGGGGAGGSAGYIYIVYVTLQGVAATNALRASGGDGGNGGASGGAGSTLGQGGDGGNGGAIIIIDALQSTVAITNGTNGGANSGITGGTGNVFQANL